MVEIIIIVPMIYDSIFTVREKKTVSTNKAVGITRLFITAKVVLLTCSDPRFQK